MSLGTLLRITNPQNQNNNSWYKASEDVIILTHTGRIDIKESGLSNYGGQQCKILHILLL